MLCKQKFVNILLIIIFLLIIIIIITLKRQTNLIEQKVENAKAVSKKRTVLDIVKCSDVNLEKSVKQRGKYYVLYNYVKAEQSFKCDESITLTTPGDFRFLDNVIPLVKRWNGPISVALYTPGDDLNTTLESIAYLRVCTIPEVRRFITFHLFFDENHFYEAKIDIIFVVCIPISIFTICVIFVFSFIGQKVTDAVETPILNLYKDTYDCRKGPPYESIDEEEMYKTRSKLLYPINVARNIARESAQTHFVFPSDIELYPTPNFIEKFLKLVIARPSFFKSNQNNVFVLPVFEIESDQEVPENKTRLQEMMKASKAFLFHQKVCRLCHLVIAGEHWIKANETKGLGLYTSGKRQKRHATWEPFYVCTQKEPLFDERLTWEGQGNKMSQAYALCLLDYDFHILDNAFLTHKPGIKKKKEQLERYMSVVRKTNRLLSNVISQELINLYGDNPKCKIKQ